MSKLTLSDIAKKMRNLDYAMLSTHAASGNIVSRPMSNNGDVEYDGDNFFFAFDSAYLVKDIERDPKVGVSFVGSKGLLGKPPIFIAIEARAEIIRDKAAFEAHWNDDINDWAKDGIETPGLVLITAHAARIHVWDGHDEEEFLLQ